MRIGFWDGGEDMEDQLVRSLIAMSEKNLFAAWRRGEHFAKPTKQDMESVVRFGGFLTGTGLVQCSYEFGLQETMTVAGITREDLLVSKAALTLPDDVDFGDLNCYLSHFYLEKTGVPKYYPNIPGVYYKFIQCFYSYNGEVDTSRMYGLLTPENKWEFPCPTNSTLEKTFDDPLEEERMGNSLNTVLTNWATRLQPDTYYVKSTSEDLTTRLIVDVEQVKSLFYARTLPPTESGRRSPILHWVQSHKRRLKSGTDIDISKYLRGVSEFEMYGTRMQILNPQKAAAKPSKGFGKYKGSK